MSYEAINTRLVVKKATERTTEGGIILSDTNDATLELEVVATTELTKQLQGKTIYAHRRHVVELPNKGFGTVKMEDVEAVKT